MRGIREWRWPVSPRDDGGPAYPCVVGEHYANAAVGMSGRAIGNHEVQAYGMSLRDAFAMHATAGPAMFRGDGHALSSAEMARAAYALADAMLAERAKAGG